jgi:hypothetical protein
VLDDDKRKDIDPLPGPSNVDWFAGIVAAGISGIPHWWSAPAAVLFSLVTAPLLSSSREEWLEELRLDLNELQRKVDKLTPEVLSKDSVFVAALAQATLAAMRTPEPEKREALKNAVVHVAVNAVVGTGPSPLATQPIRSDLELMFLGLIDSFTAIHLKVLRHCATVTSDGIERLRKDRDLSDVAVTDLVARGLLKDSRAYAARGRDTPDALIVDRWDVTNLGKQFLAFISKVA